MHSHSATAFWTVQEVHAGDLCAAAVYVLVVSVELVVFLRPHVLDVRAKLIHVVTLVLEYGPSDLCDVIVEGRQAGLVRISIGLYRVHVIQLGLAVPPGFQVAIADFVHCFQELRLLDAVHKAGEMLVWGQYVCHDTVLICNLAGGKKNNGMVLGTQHRYKYNIR